MKYNINQIVYFIASLRGLIKIIPMRINRIEYSERFYLKPCLTYTGECIDDPESMSHVDIEEKLYPSYDDALAEIARQLDSLRELKGQWTLKNTNMLVMTNI